MVDIQWTDEEIEDLITEQHSQASLIMETLRNSRKKPDPPTINEANVCGKVMDYEAGMLDPVDEVSLFQYLIDSGLAWTLQGHYGRTAAAFIEEGLCTAPKNYNRKD